MFDKNKSNRRLVDYAMISTYKSKTTTNVAERAQWPWFETKVLPSEENQSLTLLERNTISNTDRVGYSIVYNTYKEHVWI